MKWGYIICGLASTWILTASGQSGTPAPVTQPPPGTISSPNPRGNSSYVSGGATNTSAAGGDLAFQLQNLRSSVDQALPALRAFNQQFSQQGQGGLAGAVEGLLSRNRNSGQGTGFQLTNVLSALGALVNTNSQGTPTVNPETMRSLATLEKDLGPVQQLLQTLNVGNTNAPAVLPQGNIPSPTGR